MGNVRTIPLVAGLIAFLLAAGISSAHATEYVFTWAHPQPQGNDLGGAAFENDSIGYAVGQRGAVVKTTDGGSSWTLVSDFHTFSSDLEDLVVTGPGELIAVGASPGIFRSVDGGRSWTPVFNPSTAILHDIEHVDASVLSAVGDNGQVLRSSDGGNTWTMLASPGGQMFEQIWFDQANGYVMGINRVRRTTDGGLSWMPLPGITDSDRFNEAFFTDAQHGYIFSDFHLWKSVNGGATWTSQFFPGGVAYPANAIALGPLHFLVVSNLEGQVIYETNDGGASWTTPLEVGLGGFFDFDRLTDGTLIAVGTYGDIYRSTDDGVTWANAVDAIDGRQQPIGALAVGSGGRGAAGTTGSPGQQWYVTQDAGLSWQLDPDGPFISFTAEIAFWDADRAVVAGDYGNMWRTTDGGLTWSSVPLPAVPSNGAAWHLSLPSPGIAFATVTGQSQAVVYRTTDYGATWQLRTTGIPLSGGLTGISFINDDVGYVSGYTGGTGRMFKTTNGGASWSALTTSGLPGGYSRDLHFHDELTGIATFSNSPGGIFRTTNGGLSWARVSTQLGNVLSFFDATHGVASIGGFFSGGTVAVTEDGGVTWQTVTLPAPAAGSTVTATTDGFWVGGYGGMIMRAARITTTVAEPEVPAGTGSPSLRAIPSVGPRIEAVFELPERGHAALDIIDVTGRRVARLQNGEFDAGVSIRASWDGRTDRGARAASGVYFVRLASDRVHQAIRVVLVR